MQERLFSFVTVQMRYACMYIVYVFCIYKIYYIKHFILFHKHPKNEGLLFLMVLTLNKAFPEYISSSITALVRNTKIDVLMHRWKIKFCTNFFDPVTSIFDLTLSKILSRAYFLFFF